MKNHSPTLLIALLALSHSTALADRHLASDDPNLARQAVARFVEKGSAALLELRQFATSDDPRLRLRAKEAIGGITGHWGSQVDLIWKRNIQHAIGQEKPIMVLQLFGNLDEEFC